MFGLLGFYGKQKTSKMKANKQQQNTSVLSLLPRKGD